MSVNYRAGVWAPGAMAAWGQEEGERPEDLWRPLPLLLSGFLLSVLVLWAQC